ncbi:MAG: hypothetical protein IJK46_10730 [Prevotella sp.]|nr:hypothetical protein [Prevotella sp.]
MMFKIKREEWMLLLVGILVFAALNWLMLQYNFDTFTHAQRGGFYSMFHGHVTVSGYDEYTYITLSKWRILYQLYRHPLLAAMFYPFSALNDWLMFEYHINFAIIIWAVIMLFCDVYSLIFLYRIEREIIGLNRADATLLAALFFSFAHIMISCFVCDHFGLSMMLLLMSLYLGGKYLKEKRRMPAWLTGLLVLITSGVTLTNGVKPALAAWFTCGRRVFRWHYLLVAGVLPVCLLGGAFWYQNECVVKPDKEWGERMAAKRVARDSMFLKRNEAHRQLISRNKQGQISENPLFEWTDTKASRWDAVVENLFGESILLHREHLLEDVNISRPVIVRYHQAWQYAVVSIVVLLFLAGIWTGRCEKFLWLCLSWFAFDMVLHLVLGFGIIEVYIMAAHWAFVIPVATGYLLKALPWKSLRAGILLLALLLWTYNGVLITQYLTNH